MPPSGPTALELAMQASVDEVLSQKQAAPRTGTPHVVSVQGALDEQKRPLAARESQAAAEAAKRAADYERQLEREADEAAASVGIGSLRAGNAVAADDDDDEFGFDPVDPSSVAAVTLPVERPQELTDTVAQSAEAQGADAILEAQLQRAQAARAADAEEQVAALRGEAVDALRALRQTSAADDAGAKTPAVVHQAKSAVEKADELAASLRSRELNHIQEDEDEEEDWTPEKAPREPEDGAPAGTVLATQGRDAGAIGFSDGPGAQQAQGQDNAAAQQRMREEAERAAVEAQWAAVEQASAREAERAAQRAANGGAAGGRLGAKIRGDKIGYAEAVAYFEAEADLTRYRAEIVPEDWSSAPCLPRYVPFLRPKLKDDRLRAQRNVIFCLAKMPIDDDDDVHDRILMSIFKALTGNARDPPRRGGHWDQIGFQGSDPATDLRGVGMLSLLNGLYLVTRRRELATKLYALSRGERDWPFMPVSINLTQICLEALRSGSLINVANERNSVMEAFHLLHCALYAHMGEEWQTRQLSIRDFGHLKMDLHVQGTTRAGQLIKMDAAAQKRQQAGAAGSAHEMAEL